LQKEALAVNLEQRARELYLLDKAKFVVPEAVHVQHILIGPGWRTREMARARADEACAKLKAGEDFLAVAATYSDDPEKSLNKGDLGFNPPSRFVPAVRDQIAKMTRKGEISAPVESEYGYHIIRFLERQPAQALPFEAVNKGLMANEREKLVKQKLDAAVTEVRSSPTATAHRENVEALVVPIDDATMKRALEAQEAFGKALEARKAK
jgi:parvulin-like peptidyl-prolyl isomerase